jgi:hypothetical protein
VTIGAAEYNVLLGLVHRLDAVMALQATDAFRVGLRLGLIDPITRRQCCASGGRSFDRNRSRRAVAGRGRLLGENERRGKQQKQTSNVQRPTLNAKWKKKTPNAQ